MTPDEVALRYDELRGCYGSVSGQGDLAAISGERCATCTAAVRKELRRVRAKVRRNLKREDPRMRERVMRERVEGAVQDHMSRYGLSYGWKTTVVVRRKRRGEADQIEEKEVCGRCLQNRAQRRDLQRAVEETPEWEGIADREHTGNVAVYPRRGAAEERVASQLDQWIFVRDMVEIVPPQMNPKRWSHATAALRLIQLEQTGSIAEVAKFLHATEGYVEDLLRIARQRIAQRLAKPGRWRHLEDRMEPENSMRLAAAAERLHVHVTTLRRRWLPGWIESGEAVDARSPGSQKPNWWVGRDAVERARKERFGGSGADCRSPSEKG